MVKGKGKRERRDIYVDVELWDEFGKWADSTPISRSKWMELLIKEFSKKDSKDIAERISDLAKTYKK